MLLHIAIAWRDKEKRAWWRNHFFFVQCVIVDYEGGFRDLWPGINWRSKFIGQKLCVLRMFDFKIFDATYYRESDKVWKSWMAQWYFSNLNRKLLYRAPTKDIRRCVLNVDWMQGDENGGFDRRFNATLNLPSSARHSIYITKLKCKLIFPIAEAVESHIFA